MINGFCFVSPKEWFCECEYAVHRNTKFLDNTKEGNGKHKMLNSIQ
jgi:hypothetical protein